MKKKFLLLITMACFIFSFSACTADEDPVEEQNQPIEEQQVDPGNDGDINDDNLENDVIDDVDDVGDEIKDDAENAGDEVEDTVTDDDNANK
ncbi:hypothetical protein [Alkalibaculum bacchi]|uniref:hypothetical protein n=1 Tax=Alkalibaculum bacchi TaxID=645887 RepID=UPI0026F0CB77|nr:hypothetical protein [Alkalibaculum bacchi]